MSGIEYAAGARGGSLFPRSWHERSAPPIDPIERAMWISRNIPGSVPLVRTLDTPRDRTTLPRGKRGTDPRRLLLDLKAKALPPW